MLSPWCSSGASASAARRIAWRRALRVAALIAAAAVPARAATVLERTVVHTLLPDGVVEESTRLRVRLERAEELSEWSPYYVYLDDNRRLVRLEAEAIRAGGGRAPVGRRDQDTVAVPGAGVLHSSARFHEVTFPPLPAGSALAIEHTVRARPYFPGGEIFLTGGHGVQELRAEVRGAGAGWRWRVDGNAQGLTVEPLPDGVRVSGRDLAEVDAPELTPAEVGRGPVLRYAWGGGEGWPGVGGWFEDLLSQVPQREDPVRSKARDMAGRASNPADALSALTGFVQEKVRYVAVEIGIGGYQPSAPRETLERLWGDCKDKALLLIDLLREAGITAYPALILAAAGDRIDPEFPSPAGFNHLIVAVPESEVAGAPGDGEAPGGGSEGGGYLFIDATQTRGGTDWLHPAVQAQDALVVRGAESVLVRTPLTPEHESLYLAVNLAVGAGGAAGGGASLEVGGAAAAALLEVQATRPPTEVEAAVRAIFGRLLPGATLGAVSSWPDEGAVPRVSLVAAVRFEGLVGGDGERLSFLLPGLGLTPEPRHLAGRAAPVVLQPGFASATWNVHLPGDDCRPESEDVEVEGPVGSFRQAVSVAGRTLTVERRGELRRRWVEGEEVAALGELALAEHRTSRRRLRLLCGTPPAEEVPTSPATLDEDV